MRRPLQPRTGSDAETSAYPSLVLTDVWRSHFNIDDSNVGTPELSPLKVYVNDHKGDVSRGLDLRTGAQRKSADLAA